MDRKFFAFIPTPRITPFFFHSISLFAAVATAPVQAAPISTCCAGFDASQYTRPSGFYAGAQRNARHPAHWFADDITLLRAAARHGGDVVRASEVATLRRAWPPVEIRGRARAVPEPATVSLLVGVAALLAYRYLYGERGLAQSRSWTTLLREGARRLALSARGRWRSLRASLG